jgi:NADH dehydrogenase [ubiquinone] 1 alpha subcomplex assembly factor 5
LSGARQRGTSPAVATSPPEPFDRNRRRRRRDRAAARFAAHGFLAHHMADDLLARLESVERRFSRILVLGAADGYLADLLTAPDRLIVSADAGHRFAQQVGGVQCDEDRLPFADAAFDLVISAGVLDSVNDLPGALVLARRALKPDGLFLAAFVGAGSLTRLRAAMLAADLAGDSGVAPRIHPLIDVRAAGDLLTRAGFTLPVADSDRLDVRYRSLDALLADLRFGAQGSVLAGARPPLTRMQAAAAHAAFLSAADADGRVTESFEIVTLIGWAPDASQPRPAKRGSAVASLAAALKPKG